MVIKCNNNLRPSKIFPNWDFWFENKPSGSPAADRENVDNWQLGKTHSSLVASFKSVTSALQGCQMVYCQSKNSNLDKFFRVSQWYVEVGIFNDHLVYFTGISYHLGPFGIFGWLIGTFSPAYVLRITEKNLATLVHNLHNHVLTLSKACFHTYDSETHWQLADTYVGILVLIYVKQVYIHMIGKLTADAY
jgi:hypothetical protein